MPTSRKMRKDGKVVYIPKSEREAGNGAGGNRGGISRDLQKHFDKENARIEQFMSGRAKSYSSIEMENGQILERYTMSQMVDLMKEVKANGTVWEDDQIAILYSNGKVAIYGEGDDVSKMKMSGIRGVIYESSSTDAYAGTGVKIENYNQIYAGEKWTRYGTNKDEDDWRMDFEKISR